MTELEIERLFNYSGYCTTNARGKLYRYGGQSC